MKATTLPEQPDAKSPAGADIRFIMDGETGNMIHSTVPPHQINKATVHATVSEFWYVKEVTTPSHQPQVVHMIQNFIALTADPEGQAARASMRISEQTQGLLDAVWDQLTKI